MKRQADVFIPASGADVRRRKIVYIADSSLKDFRGIVEAVDGTVIKPGDITVETRPAPHLLPRMRRGQKLVSVFIWDDDDAYCLKIALAKRKKQIRLQYDFRVRGSLASAVHKRLRSLGLHDTGTWIKQNTARVDFSVPNKLGSDIPELLRSFLHRRIYCHY